MIERTYEEVEKVNVMRGNLKRLILTAAFIAAFCPISAQAAGQGIVNIQLEDLKKEDSDRTGIRFELYQVGEVTEGDKPYLYPEYEITTYPQSADETEKAAAQIMERLEDEAVASGITDPEGKLSFTDLPNGVYLLVAEEPNHYGTILPILLHLPHYEVIDDVLTGPEYTVNVEPKASVEEEPTEPGKEPDGTEGEGTSVKTGVEDGLYVWIFLAAVSGTAAFCLSGKRRVEK